MSFRRQLISLTLLSGIFMLLCACSKGEHATTIERKLEEKVSDEVAIGSSRAQVEAFAERLEVDGKKPERREFSKDLSKLGAGPTAPGKPEKELPDLNSFLWVDFGTIDSDSRIMYNVGINAVFYFDANGKLMSYKVHRYYRH